MKKVKSVFFLTKEEVEQKRKELKDDYIAHDMPHFELEDGTIIYGKIGYPAGGERWYDIAQIIKNDF